MKNPKLRILTYLLAAAGLLLAAVIYPRLPQEIPTHWDLDGTVTYSGRHMIFLTSGTGLPLAVLFDLLPKIDPRRQNYQKFGRYYDLFCVFMEVFLLAINGITLTETFRPGTISVPMAVMLGIGLLFLFLGNIMPKIKSNFYMGIKTPWTISSEEVWRRTHRLGGKCFFAVGFLSIICAFLPFDGTIVFPVYMVVILAACLIPGIMSYVWWRQEQRKS